MLATGPGNPPAVRVWTEKTVQFSSRNIDKPESQCLGGSNPDPYLSKGGFDRIGLDPSFPISGSLFRVFLFMVGLGYTTGNCVILSFAHDRPCQMNLLPL